MTEFKVNIQKARQQNSTSGRGIPPVRDVNINNKTFYTFSYMMQVVFSYNNNVPLNITILILPLFRAPTTIILHQLYAKRLRSSGVVYAYQISFVLFGVFFKETFIYLLCLVVFYLICKKCLSKSSMATNKWCLLECNNAGAARCLSEWCECW